MPDHRSNLLIVFRIILVLLLAVFGTMAAVWIAYWSYHFDQDTFARLGLALLIAAGAAVVLFVNWLQRFK